MSYPRNRKEISHAYRKHIAPKVNIVQNASKHTLKEILQRCSEHLPYIQLYELRKKKTLISWLPITNRFQKVWRTLQVIPQTWSIYSIVFDGKKIVDQAKENILYIFYEHQLPEHISREIWLAMIRLILWTCTYYLLTKPWDAMAYKQKFFSKSINSWDDQVLPLPPHGTEE